MDTKTPATPPAAQPPAPAAPAKAKGPRAPKKGERVQVHFLQAPGPTAATLEATVLKVDKDDPLKVDLSVPKSATRQRETQLEGVPFGERSLQLGPYWIHVQAPSSREAEPA